MSLAVTYHIHYGALIYCLSSSAMDTNKTNTDINLPNVNSSAIIIIYITVFSDVYPTPVYSPQRGKLTKNCGLDNRFPAPLYSPHVSARYRQFG